MAHGEMEGTDGY